MEISPEWQRMLQAVAEEETSGVPALVPDRGPEPTSNGGPAGHQTADAPTALEAFEGGGEQRMAGHMQGSPAHVLAVQDGSMSTDSGGSRNGGVPLQSTGESLEDLAGMLAE